MRILAKAHSNKLYVHHSNLDNLYLEARLVNDQVHYYEVQTAPVIKEFRLKEETIHELFPVDCMIHDRPFLVSENHDFYAVLNRYKVRYSSRFQELVKKTAKPQRLK